MFLLDTNVVSDLRRPKRITPAALRWFGAADVASLHISTVTVFEIQHGIVELRRRDAQRAAHLQDWLDTAV
jgi:predicted nucleic acid-binding protein